MRQMTRIVLTGLLSLMISGQARGQSSATGPARPEPLVEFPIRPNPVLLTVPVEFRNRTYQFVVDTGSTWMVFDKSLEDQLGAPLAPLSVGSGGGEVITSRYAAPEANLGPLSLKTEEPALCIDLSLIDRAGVGRVHGLIGMSFLKHHTLSIDLARHRLQLRRDRIADDGTTLPIRFGGSGIPLIDVVLPGEPARGYELDTGFSGYGTLSVEPGTFDRLLKGGHLREIESSTKLTIAGEIAARWSATDRADFAGVRLRELRIEESGQPPGQVGMGAIRRMNLVLDFPGKRMRARRVGWW